MPIATFIADQAYLIDYDLGKVLMDRGAKLDEVDHHNITP